MAHVSPEEKNKRLGCGHGEVKPLTLAPAAGATPWGGPLARLAAAAAAPSMRCDLRESAARAAAAARARAAAMSATLARKSGGRCCCGGGCDEDDSAVVVTAAEAGEAETGAVVGVAGAGGALVERSHGAVEVAGGVDGAVWRATGNCRTRAMARSACGDTPGWRSAKWRRQEAAKANCCRHRLH